MRPLILLIATMLLSVSAQAREWIPIESAPRNWIPETAESQAAEGKALNRRVLIFPAGDDTGFPDGTLEKLSQAGWRIGDAPDAQIRIETSPIVAHFYGITEKPAAIYVEGDDIVRRLGEKCGLKRDAFAIGWLYTGQTQVTHQQTQTGRYPLRGHWWSVSGDWKPTRQQVIQHLKTSSQHRGEFPSEWLDTLSYEEAHSLHSDDHEGRVQWEHVPGHRERSAAGQWCPSGNCPNVRGYRQPYRNSDSRILQPLLKGLIP